MRARQRLDEGTSEGLFYAAFELRAGIEARLLEYLDAQPNISQKEKSQWRIDGLAKSLEDAMGIRDKVVQLTFYKTIGDEPLFSLCYTPVHSGLRKMHDRLGEYLHSMRRYRGANDKWWRETRTYLEEVYAELERANSGALLGAPLKQGDSGVAFSTRGQPGFNEEDALEMLGGIGGRCIVHVEYLDQLPPEG